MCIFCRWQWDSFCPDAAAAGDFNEGGCHGKGQTPARKILPPLSGEFQFQSTDGVGEKWRGSAGGSSGFNRGWQVPEWDWLKASCSFAASNRTLVIVSNVILISTHVPKSINKNVTTLDDIFNYRCRGSQSFSILLDGTLQNSKTFILINISLQKG